MISDILFKKTAIHNLFLHYLKTFILFFIAILLFSHQIRKLDERQDLNSEKIT